MDRGMPTRSEREEVCRQAEEHVSRLVALRLSARATQIECLAAAETKQSDGGCTQVVCESEPKPGLRISGLDDWQPFEPFRVTFATPMSDAVVQLFACNQSRLRKLVKLTRCAIELKRCALVRRCKGGGGWAKFTKIVIEGPTLKSVMTLDRMLCREFPCEYAARKQMSSSIAPSPQPCCLFLSESIPDNACLLLGNQRTGGVRPLYGNLRLTQRSQSILTEKRPDPSDFASDRRAQMGYREPSGVGGFAKAADFLRQRCPAGFTTAACATGSSINGAGRIPRAKSLF